MVRGGVYVVWRVAERGGGARGGVSGVFVRGGGARGRASGAITLILTNNLNEMP